MFSLGLRVYFDNVPFHWLRDIIFKQWWYSECICKRLGDKVTVTNAAPGPENAVTVHKKLFAYSHFGLRISTHPFNFNYVNGFFQLHIYANTLPRTHKLWIGNSPILVKRYQIIFNPAALAHTQYVSGDSYSVDRW